MSSEQKTNYHLTKVTIISDNHFNIEVIKTSQSKRTLERYLDSNHKEAGIYLIFSEADMYQLRPGNVKAAYPISLIPLCQ